MKKNLGFGVVFCLMIGIASCYNDKFDQLYPVQGGTTCDTTSVTFTATIRPILAQNCNISGCHDGTTIAGGYDFSTYDGFIAVVKNGRLLGAINQQSGYFAMPQGTAKLPKCDIDKITAWVNKGYQNN